MKKQIFTLLASLTLLSLLPAVCLAATATGTLKATATVSAKCVVRSTTDVAFGDVDTTSYVNKDGAGTVVTQCTKGTPAFIFVTPTTAGDPLAMKSISTSDTITYSLYSDAGRTLAFPSATGGAKTNATGGKQTTNIYGRVVVADGTNDQVAAATDYTQALTATIEW
jgi:spore coat protein U-like protein